MGLRGALLLVSSSARGPVSSKDRPAVAFGACRASAPARRPAVARVGRLTRAVVATSGRLDGLLRCRCALLRLALPEGAPLENVPMQPRSVCGTFSRTARPPVRAITCSAESVILGPQGAREGANRRGAAFGALGSGAWRPPVASRPDASQDIFSGAWLRHARYGEPACRCYGDPRLRYPGGVSMSVRWSETLFNLLGESKIGSVRRDLQ
jgi:hypothetical protein